MVIAALAASGTARAVIVGGVFGTGNNNTSQAALSSYLSSSSHTPFSHWQNLVRVQDASGVYLGYNSSTSRGWVLSANHVTPPTNITVAGTTYAVESGYQIGTSDLKLYSIIGTPTPGAVSLPTISATPGEYALMFGRGFTNSTTSPYAWQTPGTNDANGMRWATNTVEGTAIVDIDTGVGVNNQPYVITDFDGPLDTGATAYDGQAALGDSGGGLFIERGGTWQLSGITHFVGPENPSADPSAPGDYSAYSDVAAHLSDINTITGTLVPEPSTLWLLAAGVVPFLRRKR